MSWFWLHRVSLSPFGCVRRMGASKVHDAELVSLHVKGEDEEEHGSAHDVSMLFSQDGVP